MSRSNKNNDHSIFNKHVWISRVQSPCRSALKEQLLLHTPPILTLKDLHILSTQLTCVFRVLLTIDSTNRLVFVMEYCV